MFKLEYRCAPLVSFLISLLATKSYQLCVLALLPSSGSIVLIRDLECLTLTGAAPRLPIALASSHRHVQFEFL